MMQIPNIITSLSLAGSVVANNATQRLTSYSSAFEPITVLFEEQPSEKPRVLSRVSAIDWLLPPNIIRSEDGSYFTTCPRGNGNIKAEDCEDVLKLMVHFSDSSLEKIIRVELGKCQMWWSGECMAKVCALGDKEHDRPYYEKPEAVVDRLRRDAMDFCVRRGDSAAVSDYWKYTEEGGLWRYFLQKKH